MARSILLMGMFTALALSMAKRRAKLLFGSVPARAAMAMALPILVNTAPRAASLAPFSLLIVDHLLCPLIYNLIKDFCRVVQCEMKGEHRSAAYLWYVSIGAQAFAYNVLLCKNS